MQKENLLTFVNMLFFSVLLLPSHPDSRGKNSRKNLKEEEDDEEDRESISPKHDVPSWLHLMWFCLIVSPDGSQGNF